MFKHYKTTLNLVLINCYFFNFCLDSYDFGRKAEVTLPTAPRAARGPENDAKIPQEPPFQAYLSNLSYEVTEDDLAEFFSNLRVGVKYRSINVGWLILYL